MSFLVYTQIFGGFLVCKPFDFPHLKVRQSSQTRRWKPLNLVVIFRIKNKPPYGTKKPCSEPLEDMI